MITIELHSVPQPATPLKSDSFFRLQATRPKTLPEYVHNQKHVYLSIIADAYTSLTLGRCHVPGMMYLQVFVVVGLRAGHLAADGALEGPLVRVRPHVLREIVGSVERLTAHLAPEPLFLDVFPDVPQPVVLDAELTTTVVARERPYRLVRVHVRGQVVRPDERLRTERALERHLGAVLVRPPVRLEVPFGAEGFAADRALEFGPAGRVQGHVRLQAARHEWLLALGTRHGVFLVRLVPVQVHQAHVLRQTVPVHEPFPTERTPLGRLVVRLVVPRILGRRMEHFAAMA